MEVATDPWPARHHVEHVVPEIPGIAGEKADSRQFRDLIVNSSEEIGEGRGARIVEDLVSECRETGADLGSFVPIDRQRDPMGVAVVVHGLPQQRHFLDASGGEQAAATAAAA